MACANRSVVAILLCLLAHAVAELDAGTCASQAVQGGGAGCEASNDEASAMLQITKSQEAWTYLGATTAILAMERRPKVSQCPFRATQNARRSSRPGAELC
mmetsp:Transcript_120130/g.256352  ORF Transcript_120130/g.256352 Transcript_120130/m.256352 type:complete len:101 (-) Transcript_120130:767-1069(-)